MNSLRLLSLIFAAWVVFASAVRAQPGSPYRLAEEGLDAVDRSALIIPRKIALERDFLATEAGQWSFYHDLETFPADMRSVLTRILGADVVSPGQHMDFGDVVSRPDRVQHLYTAVTPRLGVIVWHTGGSYPQGHLVVYDREVRDACRYGLLQYSGPILPIDSVIRWRVENPNQKLPGCEYLKPDAF